MDQRFNFTKAALKQLAGATKRICYWDEGGPASVRGLLIEVFPTGRKVFRFRRKLDGKNVNVTLGEFPTITIEQARKLAAAAGQQLAEGANPNEIKRQRRESFTVGELFGVYLADFAAKVRAGERRQKSLDDADSMWRTHIKARLEHAEVRSLTVDKAKQVMAKIKTGKSYAVHNKTLTLLKSMFADEPVNPFAGIRKMSEPKRERVLSRDELARLLAAVKDEPQIYQDVVMLLVLTGQRKSCVYAMEWREINQHDRLWVIPTSKMKSKRPHAVPLSHEAMAILERRSREAEPGQDFVFPSQRSRSGHIVEKTGATSFWCRIVERAGLHDDDKLRRVTPHDLRRSLAAWQVTGGGSLQAASKLLGHSDIGITSSTYAHLELEAVRDQLQQTTTRMLGEAQQTPSPDKIAEQLKSLPPEQRAELLELLQKGG